MAQPQTTQKQLDKLNKLESAIVSAEESAEDARWQQAKIVASLLEQKGVTTRSLAAEWHEGGAGGRPYSHVHVGIVARMWKRFGTVPFQDRPTWGNAYQTVKENSEEIIDTGRAWGNRMEARPPKSEATAEQLVQNLIDKAPPAVVDTVYHGLREARAGRYQPPQERERRRKEADTFAKGVVQPVVNTMTSASVILDLENALDELKQVTSIDATTYDRISVLLDEIRTEAEVKRAMEGVQ